MSHRTNQLQEATYTLPANEPVDVLFDAEGMDTTDADELQVFLANGGANPVTSIQRRETTLGRPTIDDTQYGPLAGNDSDTLTFTDVVGERTRLLLTSALGTTVTVSALARAED